MRNYTNIIAYYIICIIYKYETKIINTYPAGVSLIVLIVSVVEFCVINIMGLRGLIEHDFSSTYPSLTCNIIEIDRYNKKMTVFAYTSKLNIATEARKSIGVLKSEKQAGVYR